MKTRVMLNAYEYEMVKPVIAQRQIVKDRMYITLPRITNTRIEYGSKHSVVNDQTFSVDVACNIINDNMTIYGAQSHEVVIARNYTMLVRKYNHLKFATVNLSFVKSIDNADQDNMIISQDTMKIVLPTIPVFFLICIILTIIVIYFRFCKSKVPKPNKKVESEIESPNSDKEAAKWIVDYIKNNPRMSMNPYLNPYSNLSRRNINPAIQFDD